MCRSRSLVEGTTVGDRRGRDESCARALITDSPVRVGTMAADFEQPGQPCVGWVAGPTLRLTGRWRDNGGKGWNVARLISAADTAGPLNDVDFGLIYVVQEHLDWPDPFELGGYAVSRPGMVKLMAGTKYALAQVRVELWDGDPGVPGYPWEEYDEVPFQEVSDAGPLVVQDFVGTVESSRLDIAGLGRARVGVAACGRRRGLRDERLPESWLVRLWPDPVGRTAFDGMPRRSIAPRGYLQSPDPPWSTLLSGSWFYVGCHAAERIQRAMYEIGRPCTREEIADMWSVQESREAETRADARAELRARGDTGGPFWSASVFEPARWDGSALGVPELDVLPTPLVDDDPPWFAAQWQAAIDHNRSLQPRLDELAQRAGMASVVTYEDVLNALVRIGVLAVCGAPDAERYVPSPALIQHLEPPPGPTYVAPPDGFLLSDIVHLLHWEPGRSARWTAAQVAYRLGEPIPELVSAFEALRHQERPWPPIVMVDPGHPIAAETVLELRVP